MQQREQTLAGDGQAAGTFQDCDVCDGLHGMDLSMQSLQLKTGTTRTRTRLPTNFLATKLVATASPCCCCSLCSSSCPSDSPRNSLSPALDTAMAHTSWAALLLYVRT